MKKKGLVISTVVMVVVLIASLTTATYAWINTTGAASVSQIQFAVTSDSDLSIGVSAENTYKAGAGWAEFYSDNTTFTLPSTDHPRGQWTGDTNGLGMSINTGLDMSQITQAVYSFSKDAAQATAADVTAYLKGSGQNVTTGLDRSANILKATGSGSTITGGFATAVMNGSTGDNATKGDYLDVVFGVAASKNEVTGFGCLITIKNKNGLASVGSSAALHAVYSIDGQTYYEVDLYGDSTSGSPISGMTEPSAPSSTIESSTFNYATKIDGGAAKGDATLWIPLYESDSLTSYAPTGEAGLKQLHLIIYLCGPDSDCSIAVAASSTINIEFLSINKSTEANA